MLANSSKLAVKTPPLLWATVLRAARLLMWVVVNYVAAQLVIYGVMYGFAKLGFLEGANMALLQTLLAASIYVMTLGLVFGIPWLVKRRATRLTDVGLWRLPTWMDIGLAPAAFVVYLILASLFLWVISKIAPGLDLQQAQDVGFEALSLKYEYILAFITLVVVAPVAEEVLFRGYVYGKLRTYIPIWVAVVVTSVLFAAVHGQWNVAFDTFILSIVMCGLREITGSIWAGILLHMMKNGIAFYFLFINPSLLHTIGG